MFQATRLGETCPGRRNSTGKGPPVGEWLLGLLGASRQVCHIHCLLCPEVTVPEIRKCPNPMRSLKPLNRTELLTHEHRTAQQGADEAGFSHPECGLSAAARVGFLAGALWVGSQHNGVLLSHTNTH